MKDPSTTSNRSIISLSIKVNSKIVAAFDASNDWFASLYQNTDVYIDYSILLFALLTNPNTETSDFLFCQEMG